MNKLKIIPLCLMLLSTQAFSATTTASPKATATLISMCQISSVPSVNFGSIGTAQVDISSPLVIKCTKGTTYNIFTNPITETTPNTAGNTSFAHKMTGQIAGNNDTIAFNIFKDSGYVNIISGGETARPVGNPSYVTQGINGTGTGNDFTHNLYFRNYGNRNVSDPNRLLVTPDFYSATVTLTLTY